MKDITLALSLVVLPVTATAHHSFSAVFDPERMIDLEGEVTEVLWRNPHVRLEVRVSDGQIWEIETHSVSVLTRKEVPPEVLEEGDRVRLAGNPARRRDHEMFAHHALLASGQEVVFSPNRPPRWTDQVIGTDETWGATEGDGSRPDLGLFRAWSTSTVDPEHWPLFPEDLDPGAAHDYPLTAPARAALERFDPLTDAPTLDCQPTGMPAIMNSPYPMAVVDQGDRILLRQEGFDTVRTVHLEPAPTSDPVQPSLLGYSVGRWEGDTLIVTTTKANWGHFDTVGIPLSTEAEIVEWFTPTPDGSRLDYRMRVTDGSTFTEPVVLERSWIWLPEAEVRPYECVG